METEEKTRKTYQKPQLARVKLEIEQAVLQACKTASDVTAKGNKVCGHPGCKDTIGS